MRPRLPKPESINIVPWPKFIASMVSAGVWDRVVHRYAGFGAKEVRQAIACLEELRAFEREELRRAITGENYETLWDVSGPREEEGVEIDDEDDDGA
jgi:hypothetical protein